MGKLKIAVVGASGFVGSQISNAVLASGEYELIPIRRGDSADNLCSGADIIIHSANPAKRFNAENNPEKDFIETVEKTAGLFALSRGRRFVLISSLSCRTQPYTHYGRHRRACELIVLTGNSVVVRLGPMFGGSRKQDMLHDILSGRKVYVSAETRYAYVDVAWAGKKIVELACGSAGVKEIGAKNAVRLGDIATYFESKSEFEGREEHQSPENFTDGPDANDVYEYAKNELKSL